MRCRWELSTDALVERPQPSLKGSSPVIRRPWHYAAQGPNHRASPSEDGTAERRSGRAPLQGGVGAGGNPTVVGRGGAVRCCGARTAPVLFPIFPHLEIKPASSWFRATSPWKKSPSNPADIPHPLGCSCGKPGPEIQHIIASLPSPSLTSWADKTKTKENKK